MQAILEEPTSHVEPAIAPQESGMQAMGQLLGGKLDGKVVPVNVSEGKYGDYVVTNLINSQGYVVVYLAKGEGKLNEDFVYRTN